MAAITAAMVKELRVKTDAPMMECKKALTEADGDMAKAEEILRVKLGNKATKAAARIAAEGVVAVYLSDDRKLGAILEVNSETDFVAKNPEFLQMAADAVRAVAEQNPADIEVPNHPVDMSSWGGSACYPRSTFYPLSDGVSIHIRRITMPQFPACSACLPPSQAPLCHCTL